MSPVTPGKAKLGIQPYPVKDLKLDGYLPKVLYLPGDIAVNVGIVSGQYKDDIRTIKTNKDGVLRIVDAGLEFPTSGSPLINLFDNIHITGDYATDTIFLPKCSKVNFIIGVDNWNGIGSHAQFKIRGYDTHNYWISGTTIAIIGYFAGTQIVKYDFGNLTNTHKVAFHYELDNPGSIFDSYIDMDIVI